MHRIICNVCQRLLGTKWKPYHEGLERLGQKYNITNDTILYQQGEHETNFKEDVAKLVLGLCKDYHTGNVYYCCQMNLLTTIESSKIIH